MIGGFPKRPSGSSPEALFMQWLWDNERQKQIGDVAGARVMRTTRGQFVIPIAGKKGMGAGISVVAYEVASRMLGTGENIADFQGDYLLAKKVGDSTHTKVKILIPYKLRSNIAVRIIDTVTFDYGPYDSDSQTRLATIRSNGITELQVIVPRYLAGDIIFVVEGASIDPTFPGDWAGMDANIDGRAWARKYNQ